MNRREFVKTIGAAILGPAAVAGCRTPKARPPKELETEKVRDVIGFATHSAKKGEWVTIAIPPLGSTVVGPYGEMWRFVRWGQE